MHYYQFNIGDYLSHTSHLTPLEDIAYRRLLDLYYLHEQPLSDDVQDLAKKIRMREHCKCIADVLQEFFKLENGTYRHERVDSEIKSFRELSKSRKKAAKTRWANKNKVSKRDASALQVQSKSNAKQEPRTKNQEPLKDISSESIDPPLESFDCTKGDLFNVYQKNVDLWSEAYPAVNVVGELSKIKVWLMANPKKIKTFGGMPRFINNWLSRAQDRGGNERRDENNQKDRGRSVIDATRAGSQNPSDYWPD